MPTFATPEPVSLVLELAVGDVAVTATDRLDTVVLVRPKDASHDPDVRAAEATRVEFAAGRLLVTTPNRRRTGLFGRAGAIEVTVELPTGSQLRADAYVAALRCRGRLGECRIRTGVGDLALEVTGALDLSTGAGAVVVDHVQGRAEVGTGSGALRVGVIDGAALVKNSNGDVWIGRVGGDVRVQASNGDIAVDRAQAGVDARTANGDVRIGEVARGVTALRTAMGVIEVGVSAGTAARLDVNTRFGTVHNELDAAEGPAPSDERVEVHARTSYGDIVIRRRPAAE